MSAVERERRAAMPRLRFLVKVEGRRFVVYELGEKVLWKRSTHATLGDANTAMELLVLVAAERRARRVVRWFLVAMVVVFALVALVAAVLLLLKTLGTTTNQ